MDCVCFVRLGKWGWAIHAPLTVGIREGESDQLLGKEGALRCQFPYHIQYQTITIYKMRMRDGTPKSRANTALVKREELKREFVCEFSQLSCPG